MTCAQLEAEAERNSRLHQTKAELLQSIHHEMKAPLTVIAAGVDFADQEIHAQDGRLEEAEDALNAIRTEVLRLGRMIDELAGLNSLNGLGGNRKRTDLAAQLRTNAAVFRYALEQQGNTLTIDIAPGMPSVYIERDQMTQVVSNLLLNAAEHTQNGCVALSADHDREAITVRISDTGTGVAPELLPRMFERGFSGRGSSGIGLAICKTVVEAHGGTITAASPPGEGCTVTFTIPVEGEGGAGVCL